MGGPRRAGEAARGRAALACGAAGLAGKPTLSKESQLEMLNVHSPDDFMKYGEPSPHAAQQLAVRERERERLN